MDIYEGLVGVGWLGGGLYGSTPRVGSGIGNPG
jgi:hypothetical protein